MSGQTVANFADTLLDEMNERSAVLLRSDESNNNSNHAAYHAPGRDILDLSAIALSDWIETNGTAKGLRSITQRLCNALMTLECGVGLCSDHLKWRPPMRTMRKLTGFNEKN